jgi:uncharacterized membrane protein
MAYRQDGIIGIKCIGYDNEFKAEEVRLTLRKLQKDYLIDLEDAVVPVKDAKGRVKRHQPDIWEISAVIAITMPAMK